MPDSAFKLTQNELDQITEVFKTYEVDPHQANMHPRVSHTDKQVSFLYFSFAVLFPSPFSNLRAIPIPPCILYA